MRFSGAEREERAETLAGPAPAEWRWPVIPDLRALVAAGGCGRALRVMLLAVLVAPSSPLAIGAATDNSGWKEERVEMIRLINAV